MQLARKNTCKRSCSRFLWSGKEHLYDKATLPAPYTNTKILFSFRLVFFTISHVLFWAGIVNQPETFFSFFTCWGLTFTMLTFTLMIINHIWDFYETFSRSESNDFFLNRNHYDPSIAYGDMELMRLTAKRKKLWKYTVFLFEMTISMEVCVTLVFWFVLYPEMDLSQESTVGRWRTFLDHAFPLCALVFDFIFNAILFHHNHGLFVFVIMCLYEIVNASVTLGTGTPVYSIVTWKDWSTAWIVPCFITITVVSFYFFYLISLRKHKYFRENVKKRRLTIKQEQFKSGKLGDSSTFSESSIDQKRMEIS